MTRETHRGYGSWPSSTRASRLACKWKVAARYAGCSFAAEGLIDPQIDAIVAVFGSVADQRRKRRKRRKRRERREQRQQIEGSISLGRPVVPSCLGIVVGWSRLVNGLVRQLR